MEKLISPDIGVIFWTVITFLALLILLGKFAWKPILHMIDEREKMIKESIDQAQNAKNEAEKLLQQQKEIIESTKAETMQMLAAGKQEAERVRSDLISEAKKYQQEIIEQGRRKIEQETRSALQEIKGRAAELAIAAAGRIIEATLDEHSQKKLVDDYIEELTRKKLS